MSLEVLRSSPRVQLADLWALIKVKQTALLVITGLCTYALTMGRAFDPLEVGLMAVGLFFAVSGCTVLNMLLDQDIDAQMGRTANRPLPAGRIRLFDAGLFGGAMTVAGLGLSFWLDLRFGAIVLLGLAFDLMVYTVWLKRLTPLSIIFGGIVGGMPALAGRVLGLGKST